ncbi:MAG: DNA replication/repair protein RecF [Gammaproteobacteria bacterium]|nr:MAG: DNA replication/repair protein RecF [Gammaproteobacteria bacterium]
MLLEYVEAHNFRLFKNISIDFTEGLHIFFGENASGKTSILESINYLCSCKSFLSATPRRILRKNSADFFVRGRFLIDHNRSQSMSISWRDQKIGLKLGYENIYKSSEYAAFQPILAIGPFSYRLIDESPDIRRKFIDWGVFHVKHGYSMISRDFNRALMQRNKLLQQGVESHLLNAWDTEFIKLAIKLDKYRADYIDLFREQLAKLCRILLPDDQLDIHYSCGWERDKSLDKILEKTYQKDIERRFTYFGPQRADLSIFLNGLNVKETASRGQKKIITFALYLAQMQLQNNQGKKKGILMIDDMPSELDKKHIGMVIELISTMDIQILMSCISPDLLNLQSDEVSRMFHVKQGELVKVV